MSLLTREFGLRDAEIGGDGRTVVLACVPFDQPALVDDGQGPYREVFRRGAFSHVVKAPNRTELRYAHQPGVPFGFAQDMVEDERYLIASFRVAPSDAGDQILALVTDDQLNGVSVGYVQGDSKRSRDSDGPLVERTRVKRLPEVSLTPAPAYTGAGVLAVREDDVVVVRNLAEVERELLYWKRVRMGL